MSDTANKTWNQVINNIKDKINPQAFETWISPLRVAGFSSDKLSIEAPNKFFKDWILGHFADLLKEEAASICGKNISIEIIAPAESEATNIRESQVELTEQFSQPSESTLNSKYTFDSFVIGPSNRFAHAASLAVAESPAKAYNPLFIYGGVGLGKTHLMQAIGQYIAKKFKKSKILYITSEKFTNQLIASIQNRTTLKFREKYRSVDILLVDDIHFIAGKESTQEEFFHTFNTLYDAHKQIVISSDRPPKEISALEKRLVSRFEWGLVTDIQPPDLETRIAILRNKAAAQNIAVPDDVTFFIAEKIKSNIRELEGALIRVGAYSALIGRPVNLQLAEEVLKDAFKEEEKRITVDIIQKKVAEYFDLRISDMKSKKRNRAVAYPRQIAMYLSRDLTDMSLPEIGESFGGRDHTTVLHAYDKIQRCVKDDVKTQDLVNNIINNIKK